jgi:tRNA (cytidine/uridine-2'-O-)-methyltransferase
MLFGRAGDFAEHGKHRAALATKSTLHLVKPLGFSLEDRQLKRAGLDYWDRVDTRLE